MHLYLIGFRGTGKSTVGPLAAAALGCAFHDADAVLEARAGCSITRFFQLHGEPAFRDLEAAVLNDLASLSAAVIATGGGVILRDANRALMRATGYVVWLKARLETLAHRLAGDPSTAERRPNLTPSGGIAEIRELLAVREPLYRATAHAALETDEQSPEMVAANILSEWRSSSNLP